MKNAEEGYVLKGLIGSASLLIFYLTVSSLLGGFSFAIDNFAKLWYWMVPLIVGFGIQIGMFFYAKGQMHKKAAAQAAASTSMSATSMVACCAHHIADIAPFLGIAAVGLFLTKYQSTFLLIGIVSNVLGIAYMAGLINTKIPRARMKIIFCSLLILSIALVAASYSLISKRSNIIVTEKISLQTLTNNEEDVEFQVTLLSANEFQIAINTHSVDLDFDLTKISILSDNLGNAYAPVKWEGSEPGGHHRNGLLSFPTINKDAESIRLVITDTVKREFVWKIR